jgi:hypothetical protein
MRLVKLVDPRGRPRSKYSVVLEPEVAARVREVAIQERRSFSAVVRRALERFLRQVASSRYRRLPVSARHRKSEQKMR